MRGKRGGGVKEGEGAKEAVKNILFGLALPQRIGHDETMIRDFTKKSAIWITPKTHPFINGSSNHEKIWYIHRQ